MYIYIYIIELNSLTLWICAIICAWSKLSTFWLLISNISSPICKSDLSAEEPFKYKKKWNR
jgi:hypothetical protein